MRGKSHHLYHGYDVDGRWHPAPKVDDIYIYRPRPLLQDTTLHVQSAPSHSNTFLEKLANFFLGPREKLLPARIHVSGGIVSHYASVDKVVYDEYPYAFQGIGLLLEATDKGFLVRDLISRSPSEEAGLQPGDMITKVHAGDKWVATQHMSPDMLRDIVLHTSGKEIALRFSRGAYQSPEVTIPRRVIHRNPLDIGPLSTKTSPAYIVRG